LASKHMRYGNVGWVTNFGEFGTNAVLVFEPEMLTKRQWRIVNEMHETDRYNYIRSIIDQDSTTTEEYEEEYS
jgi:hypothetical protein